MISMGSNQTKNKQQHEKKTVPHRSHSRDHAHDHSHGTHHCHNESHRHPDRHGHHHEGPLHSHHSAKESLTALLIAFFLNGGFCVIEAIGGYYASSQAIMADALHDFGDSLSLLLLITLKYLATKPASNTFSFGYRRLNILGAAAVGVSLVVGSLAILGSSLPKLLNPTPVNSPLMLILSIGGILVNGFAFYRLKSVNKSSLGENLVSLHLLEDLWGWVIVFFGALAIYFFAWYWLDPLLSIFLAFFILWRTFIHLQQIGRLLLLGSGNDFSVSKITDLLKNINGVIDFHHIHVWELDTGFHIITAHLVLKRDGDVVLVKQEVRHLLQTLGRCEVTLEIELEGEKCLDPIHPESL